MADNTQDEMSMEDVIDIEEQQTEPVSKEFQKEPDVTDADKTLYELLLAHWSKAGSKSVGTLTEWLDEDEDIQKDLFKDYLYTSFKALVSFGDVRVRVNEFGSMAIISNKDSEDNIEYQYCGIILENGRLTSEKVTKVNSLKVSKLLPSVVQTLNDIKNFRDSSIPKLSKQMQTILLDAFKKPMTKDDEYIIPGGYRRQFAYVVTRVFYTKCNPNTDCFIPVYTDIASTILTRIIKKHLVKENFGKNTKLAMKICIMDYIKENFLPQTLEEYTEDNLGSSDGYDKYISDMEQKVEHQLRALGC